MSLGLQLRSDQIYQAQELPPITSRHRPGAPLSIERQYIEDNHTSADSNGKIILVNIEGYYDTLDENPNTAFQTLPCNFEYNS